MFITLEGPEGSGKTTQALQLVVWLRQQGYDVLSVREPGGTDVSDAIRHILLDFTAGSINARTELLLFCASRAQLVSDRIKPHLSRGGIVVCDRFADSTLAYQGYGRGLDIDFLKALLRFATDGVTPDLTLLLDIDVDTGLHRKTDKTEWNRLDAEEVQFHRRVRSGYLTLAAEDHRRWVVIPADQPFATVTTRIQQVVGDSLKRRLGRQQV
ncbi:MAG: dTMP kinase [Chloroflexi bacterium]|nr:dTMP kinase [Chloroflexota bacterium]